ncbi:MAG: hypothetical protein AAFX76_09325, partial [Planctomycetota bacterium]
QSAFTLAVHSRERFAGEAESVSGRGVTDRATLWAFAALLTGATGFAVWSRVSGMDAGGGWWGLTPGEVGYRAFLMVYGAIFPGYVLICVLPTARAGLGLRDTGVAGPSRRARWGVFVAAVLVGYPLGFVGLVVGPTAWLLGLYGVLALGRVVVELLPAAAADI